MADEYETSSGPQVSEQPLPSVITESSKPEIPVEQSPVSTLPPTASVHNQETAMTTPQNTAGSPPTKASPVNNRQSPISQLDQMPKKVEELNLDANEVLASEEVFSKLLSQVAVCRTYD